MSARDRAGTVAPATALRGPFVSRLLLKPVPFGTLPVGQRQITTLAGDDYLMNFAEWLAMQTGCCGQPWLD